MDGSNSPIGRRVHEIVGREAELEAIEGWLDGPRQIAVLIEGEAGVGKTTLVHAAVEAARAHGLRILRARPTQAEANLSFTAIGDLLEGALEEVLEALPTPQRRALAAALLLEGGLTQETAASDQRAVALAFLGGLRALSRSGPLLVVVDDIQWLDPPSATTLGFAGRRAGNEDVGFLLARRSGHEDAVTSELDSIERFELDGLSAGALHRMLRERLGLVLARPQLRRLHELSDGNPFYALELAGGYRHGVLGLDRGEPLPPTLEGLVGHRIAALPEETREALAAAAALARPTTPVVASLEALAPAIEGDVIAIDDGVILFAHPLLASAAYAALDPRARRCLHARLANVAEDEEERARHLALAAEEPDEAVATALERAGQLAAARGAPAAAADLLAESRRLTPASNDEALARRQRIEAGYASLAGDPDRARTLLESLLTTTPGGPARGEILAELAFVHLYGVDWRSSVALYRSALEEAEGNVPLEARVEVGLAQILDLLQDDLSEVIVHARRAVQLAEQLADDRLLAEALGLQAKNELLAGHGFRAAILERALALEPATAALAPVQRPSDYAAVMLGVTDEFAAALNRFERIRLEALERGEEAPFAWTVARMAVLACLTGEWRRALAYADEGLEAAVHSRQEANEAVLHAAKALIDVHLGAADSARASASRALELDALLGVTVARVTATSALGLLELSLDRPGAAHELLDPLIRERRASGVAEPGAMRYVPDEVEALIMLGQLEEAEALLSWFEERARAGDRASALAASARCRGLLAAAHGDTSRALTELEQALAEHARVAMPFERARTLLVRGSVQRRANQRRAARATLGEALAELQRLGATIWANRARAELQRIAGRASSSGELTASERRVAELVAAGQTNREVAAALFLAERTVETHLSHIYAKLGIRSRTELARRFNPS
jgi:DNA-binding CsgD family transcriptional regulator